jgi:hypothetical protein
MLEIAEKGLSAAEHFKLEMFSGFLLLYKPF